MTRIFLCNNNLFCGPIIEAYYSDKIAKYLNLNTNIHRYINWHPLATKMTYEESAIWILSFSTLGIGIFIFAFILGKQELIYSLEVSLILILPFLGIGLRWTCFNDKSKMDGDIQAIPTYKSTRMIESGYNLYTHTFCACFCAI